MPRSCDNSITEAYSQIEVAENITSNGLTYTLPSASTTIIGTNTTDTLTNKNLSNSSCYFVDNSDNTKKIAFSSSGSATGRTLNLACAISSSDKTITFPDATDDVVLRTLAQTLTNKTLTTPIISQISNTGTLTLPTSTDTLVGRATTDTLTNKTLTTPIISQISNTGTLTLPTSTDTLVGRATTDTLTNKIFNNSSCYFGDNSDTTKQVKFNTSGASTSTSTLLEFAQTSNRTITFPDLSMTVLGRVGRQTGSINSGATVDCSFTTEASCCYLFVANFHFQAPGQCLAFITTDTAGSNNVARFTAITNTFATASLKTGSTATSVTIQITQSITNTSYIANLIRIL